MWDYILDHLWIRVIIYMIIGITVGQIIDVSPWTKPYLIIGSGVVCVGIFCVMLYVRRKRRKEDEITS